MKQTYLFFSILVAFTFSGFSQTLSINSQSVTCATLGTATVSTMGGTGPFSYTWIPSLQTGPTATQIHPGTYTIVTFDAGANSTFSTTVVFGSLIPFTGTLSAPGPLRCNGVATGTAAYTGLSGGSGSETYIWTNGTSTLTVPMPFTLSAGSWTSVVTDALTGCTITNSFLVAQPPALTLTAVANTPTACPGTSVTLTATGSGGTGPFSYLWADGSPMNTAVVSQSLSGTYIYSVELKDANNCSKTQTVSVIFNPLPFPLIATSGTNVCVGNPLVFTMINTPPPAIISYFWSGPSGYTSSVPSPSFSAVSLTNSGVYSLTVTAVNSCTAYSAFSIAVLALPALVASSNPACESQTLNLSGYSPTGLSYAWSGPNGFISNVQNPSINNVALSNAGSYTVVVFSSLNTCTSSAVTTVTIYPKPTLTVTGSTVCVNQSMTLTAGSASGAFFNWAGPAGFTSLNQNVIITSAVMSQSGIYTVVATGSNGCPNTTTVSALVKALPTLSLSSNSPVCNGRPLLLNSTPAASYAWTGPNAFTSAVQNPTINPATLSNSGTYTATVTGVNGCTISASTTVNINPTPSLSVSGATVCEGKPLNISASSVTGASYLWSGPGSYTSIQQNILINPALTSMSGIYQLTVTNAAGCTNTATAAVIVNPVPTPFIIYPSNICEGKDIFLAASPTGMAYNWSGPALFTSTLATPTIVAAGLTQSGAYSLTLTDANNCTTTGAFFITVIPRPVISVINQTVCAQSVLSLLANAPGATSYSWSGPNNYSSNLTNPLLSFVNVSQSGNYTVTVNSANGCTNEAIAIGSVVALPVITTTISSNVICAKESATISASGANSYTWSTSALNYIVIVSPTVTTSYTVSGTGSHSCTNSAVTTLSVDLCSGIHSLKKASGFFIYPNPAQNELNIQSDGYSLQSVAIINSVGQIIKTVQAENLREQSIDISSLDNGVYLLQVQGEKGIEIKRFVVSR